MDEPPAGLGPMSDFFQAFLATSLVLGLISSTWSGIFWGLLGFLHARHMSRMIGSDSSTEYLLKWVIKFPSYYQLLALTLPPRRTRRRLDDLFLTHPDILHGMVWHGMADLQ